MAASLMSMGREGWRTLDSYNPTILTETPIRWAMTFLERLFWIRADFSLLPRLQIITIPP